MHKLDPKRTSVWRAKCEEFHRRRLHLYRRDGTVVEVGSDRGLHLWRRPHNDLARLSLAGRRTLEQVFVVRQLGRVGAVPPGVVLATCWGWVACALLRSAGCYGRSKA